MLQRLPELLLTQKADIGRQNQWRRIQLQQLLNLYRIVRKREQPKQLLHN